MLAKQINILFRLQRTFGIADSKSKQQLSENDFLFAFTTGDLPDSKPNSQTHSQSSSPNRNRNKAKSTGSLNGANADYTGVFHDQQFEQTQQEQEQNADRKKLQSIMNPDVMSRTNYATLQIQSLTQDRLMKAIQDSKVIDKFSFYLSYNTKCKFI